MSSNKKRMYSVLLFPIIIILVFSIGIVLLMIDLFQIVGVLLILLSILGAAGFIRAKIKGDSNNGSSNSPLPSSEFERCPVCGSMKRVNSPCQTCVARFSATD